MHGQYVARTFGRETLTTRDDDAVNTEERIWDLTQAINVKGVWFGCKHAVIAMRNVCQLSLSPYVS
jgi:hypothetical protein